MKRKVLNAHKHDNVTPEMAAKAVRSVKYKEPEHPTYNHMRELLEAMTLERDQLAARVAELEEAIGYTLIPDNLPSYHDEGMGGA